MIIRSFDPSDMDELKRIHAEHFKDEFNLPDFLRYLCAFTIEDEKGILTMGGVRFICECSIVTDLSRDPRDRIKALYQMLDAVSFITRNHGFDQIYVWSQNAKYTRRLIRNGFKLPAGQSLILDL